MKTLLTFVFLSTILTAYPQTGTVGISLIQGSSGNYRSIQGAEVSWSTGEPSAFLSIDKSATQGFQQPRFRLGQTITGFILPDSVLYSAGIVTFSGISSSGLPVTFSSSNPQVAAVFGNAILVLAAGTVTVTASQIGNDNYRAAEPVAKVLTIGKLSQSITGLNASSVLAVGQTLNLSNVEGGGSRIPVIFKNTKPNVLSANGSVFNAVSIGVDTVIASQKGNSNYFDATDVKMIVTVTGSNSRLAQSINRLPPNIVLNLGDTFLLNGSASSGLALTYNTGNSPNISISGNVLHALIPGIGQIDVVQEGNDQFFPAIETVPVLVKTPNSVSTLSGILGTGTVTPGRALKYRQILQGDGYTYSWIFSGGNLNLDSISTSNEVVISFPENSSSGNLYSYVYDSNKKLVDFSVQEIFVNTTPSAKLTLLLGQINCEQLASNCRNNYIKSFKLGNFEHASDGCSQAGYGDFTAIGKLDSLVMGNAYEAKISSNTNGNNAAYFGIWIDYDNNGDFAGDEFLSSTLISDTLFSLKNLLIRNDQDFIGPRRLRIKMQTSGQVLRNSACNNLDGEGGETEDYLAYIQQADRLLAPNVITPNNDGKNDLFVIHGINPKKPSNLVIMDRWGNIKYEKPNYENSWDGTDKKGQKLTRGTYFYFFSNGQDKISGFVEVLNE